MHGANLLGVFLVLRRISSLNSFRNLAEIPSGPVALLDSTLFSSFKTPFCWPSTSSMKISAGRELMVGVSFVGFENTLQYCLFIKSTRLASSVMKLFPLLSGATLTLSCFLLLMNWRIFWGFLNLLSLHLWTWYRLHHMLFYRIFSFSLLNLDHSDSRFVRFARLYKRFCLPESLWQCRFIRWLVVSTG